MIDINTYVFHKKYGIGQIKQIESKSVDVYFTVGIKHFPYPSSINKDLYEVYDKSFVIKNNKLIRYIGKEKDILIPPAITIIGHKAFEGSDIETVSFESHVEKIEDKAFQKCKRLIAVLNTDNLETIGSKAFLGCISLVQFKLPNSLWNVEGGVFSECLSLGQVSIPSKIKKVDHELFKDCFNLENVYFEGEVKSIENDAFCNCDNLKYIFVGDSLNKIGKGSFNNCPQLLSIYLPKSVKSIHKEAFDDSIIIKGEKRSYAEKYSKKYGLSFMLANDYDREIKSTAPELPRFIKKQEISDEDYKNILSLNENSNLPPLEDFEASTSRDNQISLKSILNNKAKRNGSLSSMTTMEKIAYSALAVIALFCSKDNLGNIFEQIAYGHVVTNEGTYTGDTFLGSISGEGTMEYNDGQVYNGEWSKGLPDGNGELFLVDGSSFVGSFEKGVFSNGEYIVNDNQDNLLQFEIENSEPISFSYILKDGTIIEKDLLAKNAEYSIQYPNGDSYTGTIRNKTRNGNGEYIWEDSTKYVGAWSNDLMNGDGVLSYASGIELSGQFFDNNLYDGAITLTRDNYVFSIMIEDGVSNGEYAINNNYEETYRGSIYSQKVKGTGEIEYKNNDKYEGEIVGGKKQGYGEYTWSNGTRYVGYWKDDTMNGSGTYYYGDTQRIEGTFVNGKPNGTCYYYDKDGTAYTSYWNNGEQTSIYKR